MAIDFNWGEIQTIYVKSKFIILIFHLIKCISKKESWSPSDLLPGLRDLNSLDLHLPTLQRMLFTAGVQR